MTLNFTTKLLLGTLCAGVLALSSCKENEEPDPTLTISAKTVTLTASGVAQRIEIKTNQVKWTASQPLADNWCSLKQEANTLIITAEPLTTTTPRTTKITITAGSLTKSVTLTQAGADALLSVDKQTIAMTADGTGVMVAITTNLETWSSSRPEADSWCTLKRTGNTLEITANAQTQTTPRSTDVSITGEGIATPIIIKVTQAGATPSLSLSTASVELDITGTKTIVAVTTNLATWRATRPEADSWCTIKQVENNIEITATICTVALRTTTITVDNGEGELTKTIAVSQKGGALSYEIVIPTDFSECAVKKVMYNQAKIAEICLEYIQPQNKQMIVVYPVINGKVDLTQGIETSTGGTIVWDLTANTCAYTAGTTPNLEKVWIEDSKIKTSTESANKVAVAVSSELLVDVRGAASDVYRIVKIGTQYWMADNLRAERYLDGSAISTVWDNNTTGAYIYLYNTPADYKLIFGALYNGFATYNAAGLAPEGWEIPANIAWTKLRTYIKADYGTKLKSKEYWRTNAGTNITGFDARPAQNYSTTTDFQDAIEIWFWSKDVAYDFLSKTNSQFYARLTDGSVSMVFSTNTSTGSFHSQAFGHSVRCIRK